MAPKPAADGLLAAKLKATSARVILALVAAAAGLALLAGCGGGGGDASTETASVPRPAQAGAQKAQAATRAKEAAEAKAKKQAASAHGQGAAKRPQHVVAPKGSPEPAPTPAEREQATVADISLTSPAFGPPTGSEAMPATYTCEGEGTWPALRWQGIPAGTQELALFVMNAQPVNEKLFFDWALAGIDPSLEGLEEGRLPKGAVVGQNSAGKADYEICPPKGSGETYVFALYALPKPLAAKKGFEPHALREEVLEQSGDVGLLAASYARG